MQYITVASDTARDQKLAQNGEQSRLTLVIPHRCLGEVVRTVAPTPVSGLLDKTSAFGGGSNGTPEAATDQLDTAQRHDSKA